MDHEAVDTIGIILSLFGGVSLVVWTSVKAKLALIKANRTERQSSKQDAAQDSIVLAELRTLKQQMAEMHSTSHQFDISFDEALNRMEGRVGRLETKSAASTTTATETPATLRNGQSQ